MKKIFGITLLFILLFINAGYIFGQNSRYLLKDELFTIYHSKLSDLKLPIVDMKNIKLSEFEIIDYKLDERYGRKVVRVCCARSGFEMRIDAISGRIIGGTSTAIMEKTGGQKPILYEGGSKPTRSKNEILKQAGRYLTILNDGIPTNLLIYQVNYEVQGWYDSKYSYKGEWKISWKRKEGEYEYHDDSIIMYIDEDYGLAGYGYNIYSKYDPPKQIKITKEKALEISSRNIDTIITSPSSRGWFDMYKAGNIKSAELKIVNPNYFHDSARYKIVPSSYARLAWVVVFECIGKKLIEVKGQLGELEPIKAQIWIDAETGEILGGG